MDWLFAGAACAQVVLKGQLLRLQQPVLSIMQLNTAACLAPKPAPRPVSAGIVYENWKSKITNCTTKKHLLKSCTLNTERKGAASQIHKHKVMLFSLLSISN